MLAHLFHTIEFRVAGLALIKEPFSMYYLNVLHQRLDFPKFRTASITDVPFEDIHPCLNPHLILIVPTFST
jgi:hypothetical protein